MNTTRNVWQIISAIVAVISLGWGVYQYTQKEYQQQIDAARIIKLTDDLLKANKAIQAHKDSFAVAHAVIDSLAPLIAQSAQREDSLMLLADFHKAMAEKFKDELDEKPVFIHADDNQHLDIFRRWASAYDIRQLP